ncbi:cyclin-like protein [Gigaspora margarita]|uniref:Cyclin-like protein n=1 Tax=Gigaspora margarita TaxID=4874 RepID=A0A8H4AE14_GIGMA|nr:cyclin-like protein [Gigaspora margarita]
MDLFKMSKLSLQNAILTYEQLETTPSKIDEISEDLEDNLRKLGCDLIQSAGILLRLPQVAMATAQVLFQRFFYVASLRKFSIRDIGMGSLFLASKVQESPCKIRDLINVYHYLIQRYRNLPVEPLEYFGSEVYEMKEALTVAEMQILKKLGFNVHVQLPYGLMVNYLKVLELTEHETIPQKAWGYLNDAHV